MEVLFPTIFLVLLGFVLLLNVITLPANWIMLGLIGLWRFAYPSPGDMGVFFFAMLVGLALFGEVIDSIVASAATMLNAYSLESLFRNHSDFMQGYNSVAQENNHVGSPR